MPHRLYGLITIVALMSGLSRPEAMGDDLRTLLSSAARGDAGPRVAVLQDDSNPLPTPADESIVEMIDPGDAEPIEGELTTPGLLDVDLIRDPITESMEGLVLDEVLDSVANFFPLVEAAFLERNVTAGRVLSARGNFDTKIKAESQNTPLGFFETYRQKLGVEQPLYNGTDVFYGYRLGRGNFEPWYLERETNAGGEFGVGALVPLLRDRTIDDRRAELWQATYDRQIAEPAIRTELIAYTLEASVAYWVWVAAGRQVQIGESALKLATGRNAGFRDRLRFGDIDKPTFDDNLRAIAEREAKLFALQQKFAQAAFKLSLFLRGPDGQPLIVDPDELPAFPNVTEFNRGQLNSFITQAIATRPEITELNLVYRRTQVDLALANNNLLPNLDLATSVSQDVGEPTPSDNKQPLRLDVGLFFDVPLQRRKALGKIAETRAKLRQIILKRDFTVDKVATEVQNAAAAIEATAEQVERLERAVQLAEEVAEAERLKGIEGEADLLQVFLREQIAIEAANDLVMALMQYHIAQAEFRAALGLVEIP